MNVKYLKTQNKDYIFLTFCLWLIIIILVFINEYIFIYLYTHPVIVLIDLYSLVQIALIDSEINFTCEIVNFTLNFMVLQCSKWVKVDDVIGKYTQQPFSYICNDSSGKNAPSYHECMSRYRINGITLLPWHIYLLFSLQLEASVRNEIIKVYVLQ